MKITHPHIGFDFRFDAGDMSLRATRDRLPDRTFQVMIAFNERAPLASCGFLEFVEGGEAADAVVSRVMRKLHDTVSTVPADFPSTAFRDALSHWLLFNFGTPIRTSS